MHDCIFCRIVRGQAAASRVYEDEHAVAFMDISPVTEGHVVVIPKAHVESVYDLDADTTAHLFQAVVLVARAIRATLAPEGLNLWQANGRVAGQTVYHAHVHLLPRRFGDGLHLAVHLDRSHAARTELDRLAEQIKAGFASAGQ